MELTEKLMSVYAQIKELERQEADLKAQIIKAYDNALKAALGAKDEPFGMVTIENIVFNVPKKVEWDQDKLKDICDTLDNPMEYIDVKLSVSETKYKSWPSVISKKFIDARTVKQGAISIKFKEAE